MATPTPFFSRSLRPSISSNSSTTTFICKNCRRNETTYRRTRKALRVKQDPSFAPSQTETQDHIIFNPPSSAPSVYHTPIKFLPKSDPRRALHIAAAEAEAAAKPQGVLAAIAAQKAAAKLPDASSLAPVRKPYEKKYHLNEEQIEEIRALRKEDPRQWTRKRLAARFDCSQFFVSLICAAPEVAKEVSEEHDKIRAKWGKKKREAREARVERMKLWGKDA